MTKVYVDGFWAAEIETPSTQYLLEEAIKNTPSIQAALKDKKLREIIPVPRDYPQFVIVSTELPQ
jgi:hypothetical protein